MSSDTSQMPSGLDLTALWLSIRYPLQHCVVFHNPCSHIEVLKERFARYQLGFLVHCEFAVLPVASAKDALDICHSTPKTCFTTAWFDGKCLSENT